MKVTMIERQPHSNLVMGILSNGFFFYPIQKSKLPQLVYQTG